MSQSKSNPFATGLVLLTGALIGVASTLFVTRNQPLAAGIVLERAKELYAEGGQIEGAWIHYDPIEYQAFHSLPLVYVGGISRLEGDAIKHYEFFADIYSGDIIASHEVSEQP